MLEPSPYRKYTEISQRLIQQAADELEKGDLVQASEKAWGAVATAVKSVAERRGWNHQRHALLFDVSGQIADEMGRPELRRLFRIVSSLHINFYEDWLDTVDVQIGIDDAKAYLEIIQTTPASLSGDFVPETPEQTARLRRLTSAS